jgi:hypothetical protein
MAELTATQRPNIPARLLGQFVDLLRSEAAQPEFLPFQPMTALMPLESMEKLSYGDPLFRMPQQSNIPMTVDRQYLIDALGLASMAPSASRATTKLSNEAADRLVRMITRNPEATAPQVLEAAGQMLPMSRITTYHGSPSLFREFDPTKVGTGEGAQAYGVGSGYTAEARPVAEEYARNLTTQRLARDIDTDPQVRSGINLMQTAGSGGIDNLENMLQTAYGYKPEQAKETVEKVRKAVGGYLYKGEIPDEILPSFLDWDKPLSQQSEEVRNALKRRVVNVVPQDKFDMGGNARLRDNRGGEVDPTSSQPWLLEATDASGTKFFGLTQKDVDRMFGAKDAKDLTGEQIYARLTQDQGSQQAASEYLNSIGVRGIRYLDQGSRSEGKGTSNFIPFRPEDYRIQEINDMPIEQYMEQGLL